MYKLPSKFLFLFLGLVIFFVPLTSFLSPIFAQEIGDVLNENTIEAKNKAEREARQKEKDTQELQIYSTRVNNVQLSDSMYNLSNMIICTDDSLCQNKPTAMKTVTNLMTAIYLNPPASSIAYTRDLLAHAGFVKPAQAQGIGFAGLLPLLSLWKVTRNIAYAAIIIVMVGIGFMIIFRMKIDPKTVISVQAALPKIILTLILITLSYPIVGFLVDMMYLVMAILIDLVARGIDQPNRVTEFQNYFMTGGTLQLAWTIFSGGFSAMDDFFKASYGLNIAGLGTASALRVLGFVAGRMLNSILGIFSPEILFTIIVFLGLLFTFIRLLMLLLNSYIQLLIGLVLAPLQLLFEAVPGRSAFSGWILNIIANLVVFPTTAILLMFGEFLSQMNTSVSIWNPPFVGLPFEGAFNALLGLGVIFLSPTLVATVKKLFHAKPVLPMSLGTFAAPLTGSAQTAMGAASQFYYLQQMPGIGKFLGGGQHPPAQQTAPRPA